MAHGPKNKNWENLPSVADMENRTGKNHLLNIMNEDHIAEIYGKLDVLVNS